MTPSSSPELVLIWILFSHWVADFVCQSDWMAQNKSKSNEVLLVHIGVYGTVMSVMTLNPAFGTLNALIHMVVDYFTSRTSSKLYKDGKIHWFFVVIGFDQFIHTATLIYTWRLLC